MRAFAVSCVFVAACASSDPAIPSDAPRTVDRGDFGDNAGPRDVGAAPVAAAADTDADTLAVGDVVAIALRRAPAIVAARAASEAGRGREDQAGRWPNPRLALEARDVPRHGMALDRGGRWVTIAQPIPLGGRIGAERGAAAAARAAAEWDEDAEMRAIAADVRRACADLVAAEASLAARRGIAAAAAESASNARGAFESGALAESDLAQVELDAERSEAAVRARERDVAAAASAVRAFVGDAAPRLAHVVWDADPTSRAPAEALDQHPAARAAAARVVAAEHALASARARRVPDVEATIGYGRVGDDGAEAVEAGLSFALPVFDRNQGNVRAAAADVASARALFDAVVARLRARRETALAAVAAADVDRAAYRDRIIPSAERIERRTEEAFRSGARSSTDLLVARRALADAHDGRIEAERALRRAEADLLETGRDLPKEAAR